MPSSFGQSGYACARTDRYSTNGIERHGDESVQHKHSNHADQLKDEDVPRSGLWDMTSDLHTTRTAECDNEQGRQKKHTQILHTNEQNLVKTGFLKRLRRYSKIEDELRDGVRVLEHDESNEIQHQLRRIVAQTLFLLAATPMMTPKVLG